MKKLILILFCFLFSTLATYSQELANDWVDHDANYYKFMIAEDGIYRISYETLSNTTILMNPSGWQLWRGGVEQPLYISDTVQFGQGDYIEFYGEYNRGIHEAEFYDAPENQLHPDNPILKNEFYYFLTCDTTASPLRIQDVALCEPSLYEVQPDRPYDNRFFFNMSFRGYNKYWLQNPEPSLGPDSIRLGDPYLGSTEGYTSTIFPSPTDSFFVYNFKVDSISSLEDTVLLMLDMIMSYSENNEPQEVDISVNGQFFMTANYEYTTTKRIALYIPVELLEEDNSVRFDFDLNTISTKFQYVATQLIYDRQNVFDPEEVSCIIPDEDNWNFIGEWPNGSNQVIIYDTQNSKRYVSSSTDNTHAICIAGETNGHKLILADTLEKLYTINELEQVTMPDYFQSSIGYDIVVIGAEQLRTPVGSGTGEDQIQRYIDFRSSPQGGAHRILYVSVEDLYDQYGYGVPFYNLAIRNFIDELKLRSVSENWTVTPQYVLLIAKGGLLSEVKYTEIDPSLVIPAFGYPPSDWSYVLDKDDLGHAKTEIVISRIPAGNSQELKNYMDKVLSHENSYTSSCASHKNWFESYLNAYCPFYIDSTVSILSDRFANMTLPIYENSNYNDYNSNHYNGDSYNQMSYDDLLNNGLGIINLLGDTNLEGYGFQELEDNWDNDSKYPAVIALGNFIGNCMNASPPESSFYYHNLLNSGNAGSISFCGFASFAPFPYLFELDSILLHKLVIDYYGQPMGLAYKDFMNESFANDYLYGDIVLPQFVLMGDPLVSIAHHAGKDIEIKEESFEIVYPYNSNEELAQVSFTISYNGVYNGGALKIKLEYANDGQAITSNESYITLPNDSTNQYLTLPVVNGQLPEIRVTIDSDNTYNEYCEENNSVGTLNFPTSVIDQQAVNCYVYPNPASDYLYVESLQSPITSVAINSVDGKLVKLVDAYNSNTKKLELKDLAPGIYSITIHTQKGTSGKTIVKK